MSTATLHRRHAKTANLMVRLDTPSKDAIQRAAKIRRVSASDYVRSVVVAQALHDAAVADQNAIALSASEQLAFWTALQAPAILTPRQRKLAALMQGKA